VLRGALAALCLIPPTVLMGATFPVLSRSIEPAPQRISWLGLLYSANIAGAVFGCVFASFYLLRVHDMAVGHMRRWQSTLWLRSLHLRSEALCEVFRKRRILESVEESAPERRPPAPYISQSLFQG
jgi:hypothetical protein